MAPNKQWRTFKEAREFARTLGMTTQKSYEDWARANGRQLGMPVSPHKFYEEFQGYPDFLGYQAARKQKKTSRTNVLPFVDARVYIQQFGLRSQRSFFQWSKSNRPSFIPSNPRDFYKDDWTSWADFLGYRRTYRAFHEARDFARSLGVKSRKEWHDYAKNPGLPDDLPSWPSTTYRGQGWIGWSDFLGVINRWNHLSIGAFLDSMKPVVEELDELELYLILSRNGMLKRGGSLYGSKVLRKLTQIRTAVDIERQKDILSKQLAEDMEDDAEESEPAGSDSQQGSLVADLDATDTDECNCSEIRVLKTLDDLKAVDRVVEARITDDQEIIEFMVQNRVAALWHALMDGRIKPDIEDVRSLAGGVHLQEIRDRFLAEFDAVYNLPLPEGYAFRLPSGKLALPNAMQRLTAFRLLTEKRLGNWSGVGSGKTQAAILAAGVLKAELTLVLAVNATLEGWEDQILDVYPRDMVAVHLKNPMEFRVAPGKMNFLVLNYELLQQPKSKEFVENFTSNFRTDLIVLDEVQFAKQRYKRESSKSKRRGLIEALLAEVVARNTEVRILAMSATPVINNLHEAVKVLELVVPEQDFSEIPVQASVANAVGVHMLLRQYGIRYLPRYRQRLVEKRETLDGIDLRERLSDVPARDVLQFEQILFEAKLRHLSRWVRRGTMIYTYFVSGIVEPLTRAIESMGLAVHHFTGTSRVQVSEFVKAFKAGKADVLIGSAPVGTGVDKLQHVLDRLVFMTLPWSNAEYQQIVGRLWRQGSEFGQVEVIIPLVMLREVRAGVWSWDDYRLRNIEYKRTLADAALDGVIPLGGLPSREEMQRRSLLALKSWIAEVAEFPSTSTPAENAK